MSKVADFTDKVLGDRGIFSDIDHLFGKYIDTELELTLSVFGITDEEIIATEVVSQRVLTDASISDLITKVALEEQAAPDEGILTRLMAYAEVPRNMTNRYFNYGENTFLDKLPETNIRSTYIDNTAIKAAVDSQYSINSTIISSKKSVPLEDEYVGYRLHELYEYKPYNNSMNYGGYPYSVANIDYNYTNNNYDVYIQSKEDKTTVVTTRNVVTITSIDAATDNKHTEVTVTTEITSSVRGLLSSVSNTTSTDETVPIGSVLPSDTTTTDSSTELDVVWSSLVINVEAVKATNYYIVKYYYTTSGEWYWWVYEIGSGGYPALDAASSYVGNLDMLPIVTLRNSTVNTNADVNSTRYIHSKQILKYIGLDLDTIIDSVDQNPGITNIEDCFIHFGIRPQDGANKVVSKVLFNMFDYVYEDISLKSDGSYLITTMEGPFNASLRWTSQTKAVVTGYIGPIGRCAHVVNGDDLVVKKQVTDTQYVQYTLVDLATATFIERAGLVGTKELALSNPYFSIPLSHFFVSKLSLYDQYELFYRTLLISMYSAQITHLEFYETKGFGILLKIVGVVLAIFSFGASVALYGLLYAVIYTALAALVAMGAMMLLRMVMRSTDSQFIRGLAIAVYVAFAVYGASMFGSPLDASQLTSIVSTFGTALSATASAINVMTEVDTENLTEVQTAYESAYGSAMSEIETRQEDFASTLTVAEVANIKLQEPVQPYIFGVDAWMYKAINIQYNYSALYDYDQLVGGYYDRVKRIGIV